MLEEEKPFDAQAVKLLKYQVRLTGTRLTDDITQYDGDGGVHYTNNDSARIKVQYCVLDEEGPVRDYSDLARFHAEVSSQFLFANGDKVQYVDASGCLVDITDVDCAVKRKRKEEEKIRVTRKVFEERVHELKIDPCGGIISASYRINMFSTHQKLKELNLDGRKYTIELAHPLCAAVCIAPVRVLTKYHRPKKSGAGQGKRQSKVQRQSQSQSQRLRPESVFIKQEKLFVKQEKHEGLWP
jgi:hypothetical protein